MVMTNNILNEAGQQVRKFRRSRDNRMLAGVCGGAAELLGVDATLLRVAMVAMTVCFFGFGVVLYGACWLLAPEADDD
ncbi:putative membrane protein [Kutzneria albida DSM 43870]|nr:putative membrane protein [Kutzneria albida DSM 43870]